MYGAKQMPRATIGIDAILIIMGVLAYIATAVASWTALIPSHSRSDHRICGLVALGRPKTGLVLALVVAVVGILGTAMNVMQLGALFAGSAERPAAAITSTLTFFLLIIGNRAISTVRGRASFEASDD